MTSEERKDGADSGPYAEKLSAEDQETLRLLGEYLQRCQQAGEQVGEKVAVLVNDESFDNLVAEISERIAESEGFPGLYPPFMEKEPSAPPPKPELASKEQIEQIWQRLFEMARSKRRGLLDVMGIKKKHVIAGIHWPNIPEGGWRQLLSQDTLATTITIEEKSARPIAVFLDITPLNIYHGNEPPILKADHPLAMAAKVRIFIPGGDRGEGEMRDKKGDVVYNVIPGTGNKRAPLDSDKGFPIYFDMTAKEATALLGLLTPKTA